MRNARNAKVMIIDEQLVGFDLGADYCAEHEWGIEGIRREFKLNDNLIRKQESVRQHTSVTGQ